MEGLVVGYVTLEDRDTELELNTIEVLGSHQGRGIGIRLLQFVEDRARDQAKQAVTLGTSRNAAGTPWRSFSWGLARGFQVVGEEENAWTRTIGPGVREIRIRKEIGPR
jgi:GNAT superfamily N-acetyltransferase